MEDKDKRFDEMYRKQLKDFQLPVSDKVLASIKEEIALDASKKNLGFANWKLYLVLVTGVVLTLFVFINKELNTKQENGKEKKNDFVLIDKSGNEVLLKNEQKSIKDQKISSGKINVTEIGGKPNTIDNNSSSHENNVERIETKQNKMHESSKSTALKPSSDTKNLNLIENKKHASLSEAVITKKSLDKHENIANASETTPHTNKSELTLIDKKENSTKSTFESIDPIKANDNDILQSQGSIDKSTNSATNLIEAKNKIDVEEKSSLVNENKDIKKDSTENLVKNKTNDSIKLAPSVLAKADENPKPSKKSGIYLAVNGGPSFTTRNLTTGNNTGAANRNEAEKSIISYDAGIEAGLTIKSHLLVSVGIRISQYGEKYNYSKSMLQTTLQDSIYTDSMNNTFTFIDTVRTTVIKNAHVQNSYQFMSIPISLGYQFNIGDKWTIAPTVGLGINYLLKGSSTWLDSNTGEQIDYLKSTNFNTTTLSGSIKLELAYKVKELWFITLQPEYSRWLQSIYKKEDELKLYPASYKINIGMKYSF
ncbi:MAG: hypothetical protein WCP52_08535 [Bacteroidota bacterium]